MTKSSPKKMMLLFTEGARLLPRAFFHQKAACGMQAV